MLALSPARDLFAPTYHHQAPFTLSHRQHAFVESPAQRRARVAFLQKQEDTERRVDNWVREQVEQSAFMTTMSPGNAKVKGHKRNPSLRREGALAVKAVPDELLLGHLLKDSRNLSSITEEDEEPYILYSTPSPQFPTAAAVPSSPARSTKKISHYRRLSDLEAIPEGPEE
ncbi:hypothetical protein BDP27DRAFT_1309367 [Rhodocollybia butyracea]|uniref:Uncharacterized protein n=1 Tax=Rhodocollybia butyracea TaxID=206335 RepID=A0A9P5QBJ1_9AGAR|nr:hypothetical protein BDP27DRAFT_1309367 [Rhodocollybia butyracea]